MINTDYNSISPSSTVTLREITAKTVLNICALSNTLTEKQRHMVAPNAVSIAQAHFTSQAWFRAIYADETPVGFVMLHHGVNFDDGLDVPGCFLWRFMIANPFQKMGFGSQALKLIIVHVKSKGETALLTSCHEGEGGPEEFYRRFGFERDGDTYGDEIGLRLFL